MGNDYLEGNYAPVQLEHTITELAVTGTISAHLDGRYLRNGPNPIAEVDPEAYHWFTGDGMVHGVRLREGKAEWYRNRWIRTPAVACALGAAIPRRASIRTGLEVLGANTNVLSHAGRTPALVEAGITNVELGDDLHTVGPCDFDGTLRGGYAAALIGRVRVPDPIMAMAGRGLRGNATLPYRWNPDYPARIGVMPRAGGNDNIRWFDIESCYVFHPLNAYDNGDTIVVDVVRHPRMFATDLRGPNEGPATLDRWTLPATHCVRPASMTTRRNFPASMSGCWAGHTATGTRCRLPAPEAALVTRYSSTICTGDRPPLDGSVRTSASESSSSCRIHRVRPKMTGY